MSHRSLRVTSLIAFVVLTAGRAEAEERPEYRNPQGSFLINGTLGIGVGRNTTVIAVGVGAGYAVFHGVVPGARGEIIAAGQIGGELAATLTLTPPLPWYVLPFALGEVGGHFEPNLSGVLYGGGGGLYLGSPRSSFALQAGWIFRRIEAKPIAVDASGPLIALSIRL